MSCEKLVRESAAQISLRCACGSMIEKSWTITQTVTRTRIMAGIETAWRHHLCERNGLPLMNKPIDVITELRKQMARGLANSSKPLGDQQAQLARARANQQAAAAANGQWLPELWDQYAAGMSNRPLGAIYGGGQVKSSDEVMDERRRVLKELQADIQNPRQLEGKGIPTMSAPEGAIYTVKNSNPQVHYQMRGG